MAACSTDPGPAPTPTPAVTSASPAARTVAPTRRAGAPDETFAVKERHLSLSRGKDRPLPTTVWYPDTSVAGPFPLVLFSHGLTSEPSAYKVLLEAWARAGFIVAAPAYPHTSYGVKQLDALDVINQPADASYVITRVLALNIKAGDPLRGRIDTARIAAAGHSAGGITTVGMFTTTRDDRLKAGIVLAGERVLPVPFTGPAAPMLFVHGKRDKTVPYANGVAAFAAVPWPRALLSVTDGGHVATDLGPVLTTTTDFLRWTLYGDKPAKARLKTDATHGGTATLIDKL